MSASVVSPVFVGRRDELASLAGPMRRAQDSEPGCALIGGEAGVGKTRLAGELAARAAAAGFTVLVGHCIELGAEGLPLAPLVDALRALARTTPPEELAELLGPAGPGLGRLLPELAPDATWLPAEGMHAGQLLELVLGLLGRLSAGRPVMLVLEDLHWADQSTLELAAFLVRSLRDMRVLLVATYRSDELHRRHPLRPLLTGWERVRSVSRIELRRFDRAEVAAQLAAILGEEPGPELIDLVFDRSGGNAYLVEELVGMVREGGDPADLPPSLRDVLLSRVDSLSEAAQRLLRVVSIAGRSVPEPLLAQVAGVAEPELFAALREAVESHLLVVNHVGHGYAFRHALTRDAVYEDMLPGERVRLHAAYGEALAREPGLAGDESAVPAALAHHWYAALDLPRALSSCVAAAHQALASYAPAEAQRHLERALEIWPRVPDARERTSLDQVDVIKLAAEAAYQAGAVDRSLSLFDQALRELAADDDPVRRALLLERRARALRDTGREDEAVTTLERALSLLPSGPATQAHAVVLASFARSMMRSDNMSAAADMAERAVAAARSCGAREVEADVTITLGSAWAYGATGDAGPDAIRAGLRLALDLNSLATALRGYVNLSDVLDLLGRHAEAAQTASEGLILASRVGLARTFGSFLTANLAEPLLRLGRWAEADRLAADALAAGPERVFAATLGQLRAELAVMRGRFDDAAAELSTVRRALGGTADTQFIQSLVYVDAAIAHGAGDFGAASEVIAAGLADVTPSWAGRYLWPLLWLGMRVEADSVTRARDRREAITESSAERRSQLTRLAAGLPAATPPAQGYQALLSAEGARAAGSDRAELWSTAADAWAAAGEPYPQAYALLRLAELQCSGGDRQAGTRAVRQAYAIASALGATPIADDAAALARRARVSLDSAPAGDMPADGALASPAEPAGEADQLARFGLTEREREILVLLAAGRSNPQIARALFISPKTASVHVSNILAKLGVSGRVEAAAVAHRLGMTGQFPA
jgi:DNA-binding CsgD family transcriptional regulator/tetratricopeptide (TPR) repeat protein